MITTYDTKTAQLTNGWYQSGNGAKKILIIGSCRSLAYLNYLVRYNRQRGDLTICYIDPFNWNWRLDGKGGEYRVDYEAEINALETNERLLEMLRNTGIYIHEFYNSYGMFNSSRESEKNIYQFGLKPQIEMCVPNFNDVHILGRPKEEGEANLEKFYAICRKTDFPEMEHYFKDLWKEVRLFWSHNHVTKHFTSFLFLEMNRKFLHLDLEQGFIAAIMKEDLFANTPFPVTEQDIKNHDLKWH